jgi:hypothetical protein
MVAGAPGGAECRRKSALKMRVCASSKARAAPALSPVQRDLNDPSLRNALDCERVILLGALIFELLISLVAYATQVALPRLLSTSGASGSGSYMERCARELKATVLAACATEGTSLPSTA